ncbi:MAG: type VI secretion system membrane subunit TssM [Myxococcales bacterium]|nr:type VI secretion system membrane subunit TssM [Myxococcales bacterium]
MTTWILVVLSAVLVLGTLGFFLRRLRERAGAGKLEGLLADQAAQQLKQAPPERRAQIQALQAQVVAGVQALKRSKLRGSLGGASALYALPWYVIIGPPGAGKTTALKHSGLAFPYGAADKGGLQGVGGTRNCDWWFSNEAILLDTAGRYATDKDDRDEWLGFLRLLAKHRPARPIDGILVAISVAELLDRDEADVEATGKKLRARMDEVLLELGMQVPVYLLLTKVDLVAGFVEFFSDLKRSDRTQAWGATIPLGAPRGEPGHLVGAELEGLVKQLHARALRRLALERSREVREKIHQFPIELAALDRALRHLVDVAFEPNAFQSTPLLRGFYFTSGTQEGRAVDRVVGRMSAAMGVAPAHRPSAPLEPKSYFLHDVFQNVIFRDKDLAALSPAERRRRLLKSAMVAAVAIAAALALGAPAYRSYRENVAFLSDAQTRAAQAAAVDWSQGAASLKLRQLTPLLETLQTLDRFDEDGVPVSMGWGMYVADRARTPLLRVYLAEMQEGFVFPVKAKLEEELARADGSSYFEHYRLLKLYLMLGDPEHVDPEWATGLYTARWADRLAPTSDLAPADMRALARPHVRHYFELLKAGEIASVRIDDDLVGRVRAALQRVPVSRRYDDLFVHSLRTERIDPAQDGTPDNLVFPPVSLPTIFRDRPEALKVLQSRSFLQTRSFLQVDGPYTERGHAAVLELMRNASGLLEAEAWVVPLGPDESPRLIPDHLAAVAKRYETEYIRQWSAFFADVVVKQPADVDDAIELYRVLSTTPYPVGRLIEVLENETQWKNPNPLLENDAFRREANRRFNARLSTYSRGLRFDVDLGAIGKQLDLVPETFRSATGFVASSRARGGDSRIFEHARVVRELRQKLLEAKSKDPALDLRAMKDSFVAAKGEAEQLLGGYDAKARELLEHLLVGPLDLERRADPEGALPGAPSAWPMPTP